MTIHDVLVQQQQMNAQQLQAYQADICNLLAMIDDLNTKQQVITTWLSQNPATT